ncbi:hypothetical protein HPB50_004875 [Hyalomma asiaticum]|uniref:Uncharacterized protein n=1 Tax=Hyalomma asiaticum TaxID=266040 RepID=A0ACB7T5L3_HYAAI|nr:hypothetical protein HPB50_004875 [Hyalomma asiaticum]
MPGLWKEEDKTPGSPHTLQSQCRVEPSPKRICMHDFKCRKSQGTTNDLKRLQIQLSRERLMTAPACDTAKHRNRQKRERRDPREADSKRD